VYGLVTVSSPSLIFGASHSVEEVIKKDVESEDSAETQEIASEIKNGTISPKDQKHYEAGLLQIQKQGIKVILTSIASQSVSVLLYLGSKNNKSLYFVPWMTEQIIAMGIGFTKTLIMAIGGLFYHVAASHIIGFMIIFSINFLFVYSVVSHFVMLRKMKRHSKEIIQSVMTGSYFTYF